MSDTKDLVQRLRKGATTGLDASPFSTECHEAADAIERLTAERDAHAVAIENQRNNALNMLQ